MLITFSILLLILAIPLSGMGAAVWILAICQLLLLASEIRKGQVTGSGAFLFMSFLFFGMRPIYMLIEEDYRLLENLFLVHVNWNEITSAMWWGTLAAISFSLGVQLPAKIHQKQISLRMDTNRHESFGITVTPTMVFTLLIGQVVSLVVMTFMAQLGKSLYGSALGAYVYELPVPLQSVQILSVVVMTEWLLQKRHLASIVSFVVAGLLLLAFTWFMREISNFRGFYLTGLVIAGMAFLHRTKERVGYSWLIVPILIVLPFFQWLGGNRSKTNDEIADVVSVEEVGGEEGLIQSYWTFYDARGGDMNIFDTFVAANQATVKNHPYILAWLYVPVHLVPRAIWETKPVK